MARNWMEESPDFIQQQEKNTIPSQPLLTTFTHYKKSIARTFAISALGSITYYGGITYVPIFLSKIGQHSEAEALGLATVAALAVIVVTPLVGWLSDIIGRRKVLLGLGVLSAILPLMMFAWMAQGTMLQAMASCDYFGLYGRRGKCGRGIGNRRAIFGGRSIKWFSIGYDDGNGGFGGLTHIIGTMVGTGDRL